MIPKFLEDEVAEYEIDLTEPPATVLDIGANIGAFSVMAAKKWPAARIMAYEPVRENVEAFRKHCGNGRITIEQLAVRAFSGTGQLMIGKAHVTGSFHDLGAQHQSTIPVHCIAAGELPPAEFIKIDTEGCELEILERLPLGSARALVCEHHRDSDIDPIKNIAVAAGLELYRHKYVARGVGVLKFARPGAVVERTSCFVAMPVYGSMVAETARCMTNLLLSPPCNLVQDMQIGDSLVSRARNTLTANFLASECSHILFIDSDLIFSPEHVARIMRHSEEVVAGFYPKKQEGPLQWVCNAFDHNPPPRADGLQNVRYIGTGFIRIARRVFQQMIEAYRDEIEFKADGTGRTEHDFWTVGVYKFPDGTRRHLSEDWYFCQRCLDMGIPVFGDTKVVLKHCGQAIYPLASQEHELQ